jgi:5'-methylthioadenosine phosphorylase
MKIGIIGGSGLEKGDVLHSVEEIEVETPYGKPSSKIKKGILNNTEVFILSRHGEAHEITPTHVNNKANIYALAKLGCKHIIATTAVGSLREKITPGDFVILNQFIDLTKHRTTTFFDDFKDKISHTSMAEPFSEFLRETLIASCEELGLKYHKIGTVLTIEGPRFSTRAESFMFRRFAHVINMSTAPEAILANEAGLEYAAVAMATDYDCWKQSEQPVSWEIIEQRMNSNSQNVKKLLIKTIEKISTHDSAKKDIEMIKSKIRTIPNFPHEGIMFRDITTLLQDTEGMKKVIELFYNKYKNRDIDIIAGIESRGFIIGGILAEKLNKSFVPIRKKGKLPAETISEEYQLEYGTSCIEMHKDSIKPKQKVLIVDDLLATGGTAIASCRLIEKLGGIVEGCAFIIELPELKGKGKLEELNEKVFTIVKFEGK